MVLWPPSRPQRQRAGVLVEVGAPFDELADPSRRFAHDHFDHHAIAQCPAGRERVGDVILEAVSGSRTPAIPPWAKLLFDCGSELLVTHQHRLVRRHRQRRAQARQNRRQ